MLPEHVGREIALLFGHVIAKETFESRWHAALVQIVGPHVMPVLVFASTSRASMERLGRARGSCVLMLRVLSRHVLAEIASGETAKITIVASKLDVHRWLSIIRRPCV